MWIQLVVRLPVVTATLAIVQRCLTKNHFFSANCQILGISTDVVNIHGGAISLGHPFGYLLNQSNTFSLPLTQFPGCQEPELQITWLWTWSQGSLGWRPFATVEGVPDPCSLRDFELLFLSKKSKIPKKSMLIEGVWTFSHGDVTKVVNMKDKVINRTIWRYSVSWNGNKTLFDTKYHKVAQCTLQRYSGQK